MEDVAVVGAFGACNLPISRLSRMVIGSAVEGRYRTAEIRTAFMADLMACCYNLKILFFKQGKLAASVSAKPWKAPHAAA